MIFDFTRSFCFAETFSRWIVKQDWKWQQHGDLSISSDLCKSAPKPTTMGNDRTIFASRLTFEWFSRLDGFKLSRKIADWHLRNTKLSPDASHYQHDPSVISKGLAFSQHLFLAADTNRAWLRNVKLDFPHFHDSIAFRMKTFQFLQCCNLSSR